jgi:predicted metalloprotease with PDZ domain
MWRNREEDSKSYNFNYSIGLKVSEEGNISDVAYGGPAQKAGVSPATKLIAVNGRQYYPVVLRDAVQSAVNKTGPIELLVKNGEYYQTFKIDYHGGEMYPHLTREEGKADVLTKIIEPMVKKK